MLALELITAPESCKTIGWYAMAVPPEQRYQSDVWEFLECVDAEEKVWLSVVQSTKSTLLYRGTLNLRTTLPA